jgi:signal transduction histidine kinase
LPSNFFTEHSIQIGSALEVALLSLGLGDRINRERREKIAAQQAAIAAHEEAVEHLKKADKLKDRLNTALKEANTELEARVKERTEQLEKAMNAAEAANKAKSEFLANMSHEIRTPMNAILGFSAILLTKTEKPEQKNYLKGINESGTALLSLLNDILDLSKIEAGKMEIRSEPLDIRGLLDEIRLLFFQKFEEKGLNFQVIADKNIPAKLFLDESRIRQILTNLIGNALKFTKHGYVKVFTRCQDEAEETLQTPGWERRVSLIFEVEDTGIGIPKDQQGIIFEKFRQQDGQTTRKYGGTGLGLAITKRLIEMMDGTVSLESEIGQGSIFRILLPNVSVAEELAIEDEAQGPSEHTGDARLISETHQTESKPETELVIPDSLKASLPELTEKLENLFRPRWEEISEILVMDEIETFASDLKNTAQEYHFEFLIAYSKKLCEYAESYNVDEVQKMIDDFPQIIEKLKAVH